MSTSIMSEIQNEDTLRGFCFCFCFFCVPVAHLCRTLVAKLGCFRFKTGSKMIFWFVTLCFVLSNKDNLFGVKPNKKVLNRPFPHFDLILKLYDLSRFCSSYFPLRRTKM